jgi:hypothetical protein
MGAATQYHTLNDRLAILSFHLIVELILVSATSPLLPWITPSASISAFSRHWLASSRIADGDLVIV